MVKLIEVQPSCNLSICWEKEKEKILQSIANSVTEKEKIMMAGSGDVRTI